MKKRKREIQLLAEAEGLERVDIVIGGAGHYRVRGFHGHRDYSFTVSATPSCHHALNNFKQDIRRAIRGVY